MHLEVTFRNLQPREEVRKRAQTLFAKLERFLDPAAEGLLTVAIEHGAAHLEMHVTTRGVVHKSTEEDPDLRTAMDRLFHRLETQLSRHKEKRIDRTRQPRAEEPLAGEPAAEDDDEAVA